MEKQPMDNEKQNIETDVNNNADEQEATAEQQLEEMKDRWVRAVAELENLRKRSERERQDAAKFAATSFAREMLSVSDNLDRALSTVGDVDIKDDVKPLLEGIEMVAAELKNIFERQGVERLDPKGQKFDPNFHQAMFEVPTDASEPGIVVEVVQQGFSMRGRLLRPALVSVAKALVKADME